MTLRTLARLLIAPLMLVGILGFAAAPAHAQDLAECEGYEGSLTFTADPTVLQPGDSVTLAGTGWPPESLVPLGFNGQFIGNAETDAGGSFTFPYVIPAGTPAGAFEFSATCCESEVAVGAAVGRATKASLASFGANETAQGTAPACPGESLILPQTVQIVTSVTTTVAPTPLPVTGSDSTMSLVQVGVVLVLVGGLVAFLAARRRSSESV